MITWQDYNWLYCHYYVMDNREVYQAEGKLLTGLDRLWYHIACWMLDVAVELDTGYAETGIRCFNWVSNQLAYLATGMQDRISTRLMKQGRCVFAPDLEADALRDEPDELDPLEVRRDYAAGSDLDAAYTRQEMAECRETPHQRRMRSHGVG